MRIYKTVIIPATEAKTVQQLDSVICDICRKVGKKDYSEGNKWTLSKGDILNTTIEYVKGVNYPDGGDRTTVSFDICDRCFVTKLQPYLESLGASSYTEQFDW
jgi:hypothetical protein